MSDIVKIGDVEIKGKTVLAPMAGVNCTSFRAQCKEHGASLIFTQMYDVDTIIEKDGEGKLEEFLNILNFERPIAIQLIGNIKDDWKTAVEILNEHADIIDINLGCPETDYIEKEAGSWLMQKTEQVKEIAKICVGAAKRPVTAKIRAGWNNKVNAVEIAQILEKEGIKAITIHSRTAEQKYGGRADLDIIKEVKDAVKVPVIGSGDVLLPGNAKSMVERTGCDLVMIGRGAMRNPQLFEYVNFILEHGKNKVQVTRDTKNPIKLIKEFLKLYTRFEKRESMNEIRNHCMWLLSNTKDVNRLRPIIQNAKNIDEIQRKILE